VKIGFDAKRLYNNFTGLGNYSRFVVDALCQAFPQNDYVLFTPRIRSNAETEFFLSAGNIQTIVPPSWMSALKMGSVWRSLRVGHAAERAGVSLYHGLSHELPADLPASIRSVVTVHDLIFLRYPQFYKAIDVAIYKKKVMHACRSANRIVAISEQTANDIVDFLRVDRAKINVVYQGCHPNFRKHYDTVQIDAVKKKYDLPGEFILNVGTIEARKNTMLIVKALNELRDKESIHLVIVGRATSYSDELKEYAVRAKLSDRIHFIHNAAFADLPLIYRAAKVFAYPSLFEGFGIPLIEAIESGLPVITSQDSCFSEAAGPGAAYINPKDEMSFTMALLKFLTDEAYRKASVETSRAYVKRFEPEVIARNMMQVYQQVLETT